jgi:hypothetical protein
MASIAYLKKGDCQSVIEATNNLLSKYKSESLTTTTSDLYDILSPYKIIRENNRIYMLNSNVADQYIKKACSVLEDDTTTATYSNVYSWNSIGLAVGNYANVSRVDWQPIPVDPAARIREIIQARQGPMILVPRAALTSPADMREVRARQTLRRILGDIEFKSFLKRGFITVKGKSGRIYQIFPGHQNVRVWDNGRQIQTLCVVLSGDFANTDSVIMRYLLILNDEDAFWKLANKFQPTTSSPRTTPTPDGRNLIQIFAELKKQRALAA